MGHLTRLARRRRPVIVAGLGLAAALGWAALWIGSASRWLEVDPVPGPLPRGSLIVSLQRDFAFVRPATGGANPSAPADAVTVRIDPGTGSHRDLFDQLAYEIRLSPDGRTMAYCSDGESVRIRPVEGGEATEIPNFTGWSPVWSPDGSAILSTAPRAGAPSLSARMGDGGTWRFAVPGLGRSRFDLPETEAIQDWSRDGRWLLTLSSRDMAPGRMADYAIYRMAPDGSDALRLSPTPGGIDGDARFSPDGKRVAYTHFDFGTKGKSLRVVDADGTNPRKLVDVEDRGGRFCWSPDGRCLVVAGGIRDAFLIDADGANRRPLGLRWERPRTLGSLLPGLLGPKADPRGLFAIEWVDLPRRPK